MKNIRYGLRTASIIMMLFWLAGCKKFVGIPSPTTEIVTTTVFNSNATATSALVNIYQTMQAGTTYANAEYVAEFNGLLSDELVYNYTANTGSSTIQELYFNAMNSMLIINSSPWIPAYNYIYQANAIIENLQTSSGVTASVKQQLTGEALFIRAFYHFLLANCYGAVPIATTTDYTVTSKLPRAPKTQVYQQVIADLIAADSLLNANYVDATDTAITSQRVRPNKAVAEALLARAYLYARMYSQAVAEATLVINSGNYSLTSLDNVFLTNSKEAIWQLQTVTPLKENGATWEGTVFVLSGAPPGGSESGMTLSSELVNSFEAGDARKTNWVGIFISGMDTFYFPYKYKYCSANDNGTVYEYSTVLRLAEQYLIRSEAEANLGDSTDAINDLDMVRARAGLNNYNEVINGPLIPAILHERRVELFTEWGHRWFDLIRTGNVNSVMSVITPMKSGGTNTWSGDNHQALYPIPLSEIQADPNLTQNSGY